MSQTPPRFKVGDAVRFLIDRGRIANVITPGRFAGGAYWYTVQTAAGERDVVPEDAIEILVGDRSPESLFEAGSFGTHEDFRRLVTYRKLRTPLDNALYSFGATRTQFFPHQYKPLLKFLESVDQRLLIADEVGLGKTIEAGLIMAELRARGQLNEMIVVCPRSLCTKWREELWRRFDEDFEIYDASRLRDLLHRFREQEHVGSLRVIVSLQTLRQRSILNELEATPLPIDLLVVDEAHHLRNPETLSHRAVRAAIDGAAASLFLTATPIHLGSENLFNILRLLRPGFFESLNAFNETLAANEPVVEAERIASSAFPPDRDALAERFDRMKAGRGGIYFKDNPLVERWSAWTKANLEVTRADVARLTDDLKQINLFAHIFTRTRKREVSEAAKERRARVLAPALSDPERRFYEAVTAFVHHVHGEGTVAAFFAAISAQRQVASCIPAARQKFLDRAYDHISEEDIDPDNTWADEDLEAAPLSPPHELILAAEGVGGRDSKFEALIATLGGLEEEEAGRKVLIFSYFKDTLRYLDKRLSTAGFKCGVIHGDIPSRLGSNDGDERARVMQRFKDHDGLQILLSSEVGAEGLDFQFCHILVNYDLPWNPMQVEQRIGRLDRLGQESDVILIFNFTLAGTVDERVIKRLYERIGIFERSIGDLEAILGDEIKTMTRELLSRRLTPDEERRIIDRVATVIENNLRKLEELEAGSTQFVGRDVYFEEQLERARNAGQALAPQDLQTFLAQFLANHFSGARLRVNEKGTGVLEVDSRLEAAIRGLPESPARFKFLQHMHGGQGSVRVTFDSQTAFGNADLELLGNAHPLIRLAVRTYEDRPEDFHPCSALELSAAPPAPVGEYVYLVQEISIYSGSQSSVTHERRRLEPFFMNSTSFEPLQTQDSMQLFGLVLRQGVPWFASSYGINTPALLTRASDAFIDRTAEWRKDLEDRARARVQAQLASLSSAHNARIERISELISREETGQSREAYLRMMKGQLRSRESEYARRIEDLESQKQVSIKSRMVGCGVLKVRSS